MRNNRLFLLSACNTVRAAIGGVLVTYLVADELSLEVQGYYYTFASVTGLQVFAELGLSVVLLQFARHEWTLSTAADPNLREKHLHRLAQIVRFGSRWYRTGAVISTALLLSVGSLVLTDGGSAEVQWVWPWSMLCLVAGMRMALGGRMAIIEACDGIDSIYKYRLIEGTAYLVTCVSSLSAGLGLWTLPITATISLLLASVFVGLRWRGLFTKLAVVPGADAGLNWQTEILPLQWRIALSWCCGYFAFQAFVPILFHCHSAEEAGRFGATWTVMSAIGSFGGAWIQSRVPEFGSYAATGDKVSLNILIHDVRQRAVITCLLVGVGVLGVIYIARSSGLAIADRFLPPLPSLLLVVATALFQITNAHAQYMRAFKKEPMLWVSVGTATLVTAASVLLAGVYGGSGVACGYFAVVGIFTLPAGEYVYRRFRAEHFDRRVEI